MTRYQAHQPETVTRRGADRRVPNSMYDTFSQLTGAPRNPPAGEYRVQYRPLDRRLRRLATLVLASGDLLLEVIFFVWLFRMDHLPALDLPLPIRLANFAMIGSIGLIGIFRMINVSTLFLASIVARDPIPVQPEKGLRVAFITTKVPKKEPLAMYPATLEAARNIKYPHDVWLLDEGDDPEVKAMCQQLGIHHFSRKQVEAWRTKKGIHKKETKYGNINAFVVAHGEYDIIAGVDPDHVPHSNFLQQMLGYFRDPNVAFVVGPQGYGNYDNFVTRGAESQQFLFHSLLQRAANRWQCPMLVGVNYAIRVTALIQIGLVQPSITEDMATAVKFHSSRNPSTGKRWRSVYTPDLLSVGEGPAVWTDYFTQQFRWSLGNNQILIRSGWRLLKMSPGRALHYALLMAYYPTTAISMLLGALTGVLYCGLGAAGMVVQPQIWLMLYTNAALFQLMLYFWNRHSNVSPHETQGSSGVQGMFMSVLSTPIYVAALLEAVKTTITGKDPTFVVTPKGDSATPDRLVTFSRHLRWAVVFASCAALALNTGYDTPTILIWVVLSSVICLVPIVIWGWGRLRAGALRKFVSKHLHRKSTYEEVRA